MKNKKQANTNLKKVLRNKVQYSDLNLKPELMDKFQEKKLKPLSFKYRTLSLNSYKMIFTIENGELLYSFI